MNMSVAFCGSRLSAADPDPAPGLTASEDPAEPPLARVHLDVQAPDRGRAAVEACGDTDLIPARRREGQRALGGVMDRVACDLGVVGGGENT